MVRNVLSALLLIFLILPGGNSVKADVYGSGVFQGENYFVFSPDGKYLVKVFHTENKTWVRIHETGEMRMLSQWQIPNFKAHTIRFSLRDPTKLLLADKKRLLVYRLVDEKQKLIFFQPRIKGREIVQAYFNSENDEIVWATKSNVFKTDPENKKQQKILSVPWEEGKINSITVLSGEDYAVNLENSKKILLLSSGNGFDPVELNRHKARIVGVQSPGLDQLVSLDNDYELILWNTKAGEVNRQLKLEKPERDAELLAFTLDDPKENLLVLSRSKSEYIGQKYALKDLKAGKVQPDILPMTMTSAGNVYSSVSSFRPQEKKAVELPAQKDSGIVPAPYRQSPLPKIRNTIFDLAKIEADNGDFEAALGLIKRIPLDDPEFGKSRELKRRVLTSIEIRNTIAAARDQYKRGNYKSARILLENALIRNPDNRELKRFLSRVDQKLSGNTWLKISLIVMLILLVLLLGFILWRYQSLVTNKGGKPQKKLDFFGLAGRKRKKEKSKENLRHRFIYKLDEIRKRLKLAASRDRGRRYKNTWMEMTARLNTMEKRAKFSDNHLAEFIAELEKMEVSIEKMDSQNSSKKGFNSDEQSTNSKQKEKESGKGQNKSQKSEATEKPPDYHAVLGLRKGANLDEIKRAFRNKLKEYHPDRHNSSDFNWVKEEADRRTRLIQEAYEILSSSAKNNHL
jgi:DnaJ-domain-containing protein 1